jgi:hypothetical protein
MIIELECGAKVRTYFASQVQSLKLRHESNDISPNLFEIQCETFSFHATFDIDNGKKSCKMKGQQFGIVSDAATTGHKLQGYTALCLIANDWHCGQNWAYVVLSRVTTMDGLYLNQPLSKDLTKYGMSEDMKEMMRYIKQKYLLAPIEQEQYASMLKFESHSL